MDRLTVNVAKCQIGFLDVIIKPSYIAAGEVIDMTNNLHNIENNKQEWTMRFDEYEEKMN